MPTSPSVARFADLLADLAGELRRGGSCLVIADKGWNQLLYHDLRERLRAMGVRGGYVDGRPAPDAKADDIGVMLTALGQLRRAVRPYSPGW